MAAGLWRRVLIVQALLAGVIAWAATPFGGDAHAVHGWVEMAVLTIVAFALLQYLLCGLVLLASRTPETLTHARRRWFWAIRAALSEPVHFARAEFAMARGPLKPHRRGDPKRGRPLLLVHGFAC